jgi:hypothetical protein
VTIERVLSFVLLYPKEWERTRPAGSPCLQEEGKKFGSWIDIRAWASKRAVAQATGLRRL